MIYGCGSMGTRIAALACGSGIDVILAGRPSPRLITEAKRLNIPWRSAVLTNMVDLDAMLANVQLVINTAGPFAHTAPALTRACIRNRCHYLDLSNEAATFLDAWSLDAAAKQAGVIIVPGAGFGTLAAETLAGHVLGRIHQPDTLSIVRTSSHGARSPGVNMTMLELLTQQGAGNKHGRWTAHGHKIIAFDLPEGMRTAVPVAIGDAFATAHATGIQNVTAYSSTRMNPRLARLAIPAVRRLGKAATIGSRWRTRGHRAGGSAPEGHTRIWMQASSPDGDTATSYLLGGSGSESAARIALGTAQKVHHLKSPGAHTAGEFLRIQDLTNEPQVHIIDL